VLTDVSKERIASIFRVEENNMIFYFSFYPEDEGDTTSTWRHIPEDCFLHRLKVFENRVLRRIFGPKRDDVKGGWRKIHNEELHSLYSSSNIIKIIKSRRM
jgi:hypothetical protein